MHAWDVCLQERVGVLRLRDVTGAVRPLAQPLRMLLQPAADASPSTVASGGSGSGSVPAPGYLRTTSAAYNYQSQQGGAAQGLHQGGVQQRAGEGGPATAALRHDFRGSSVCVARLRLLLCNSSSVEARVQVEVSVDEGTMARPDMACADLKV